ncbi:GNAT family N-acetyltransferase [Phytohalomonas tamaricis]|uniref:GNAT family N-acetyltransferase n=1 Tax=Phytohalomonas tamaricis TaxID=2081032 RepID=UPI0021D40CA0|nr:GNAT family N-acetyltransferase [Phytohalomonas tamaricis]
MVLERLRLRLAREQDGADQAEVFHHAIMQGAVSHYDREQREAWASALPREASAWSVRQLNYLTLIADLDRRCVGFCELDVKAGLVVTLYVWPTLQGQGIGMQLLETASDQMREAGGETLLIDASTMLAPRLIAQGWEKIGEDKVERNGVLLPRVRLRRDL